MTLTLLAVTGTYLQEDGVTPATGRVAFTLSAAMQDTATHKIVQPRQIVAVLDNTGHFSVTLPANDDASTSPTGVTYTVTEQIDGASPRTYAVSLPANSPGATVDLSTVAPALNPSPAFGYLLASVATATFVPIATSPTHEAGTLALLPANGTRPNGSTYLATDQNGGTPYLMVAGAWAQAAAGVNQAGGLIAGPVSLSTPFDVKAVGAVETDIPLMSLAVPASARPVRLRFKCEVIANSGTATTGTIFAAWLFITDTANNNKKDGFASFLANGTGGSQQREVELELILPAPVAAATYKLRAMANSAAPANWTSLSITPGGTLIAGATNDFYAEAL